MLPTLDLEIEIYIYTKHVDISEHLRLEFPKCVYTCLHVYPVHFSILICFLQMVSEVFSYQEVNH